MKVLTRILAAAALGAILSACIVSKSDTGSTDAAEPSGTPTSTSAPAEEISLDQWASDVDQVCREAQAEVDADPVASYVDMVLRSSEMTEALLQELIDEPLPTDAGDRAEAEAWLEAMQALDDQLQEGADQVVDGDWATGLATLDGAQPLAAAADDQADDLGLDDCAGDEADRDIYFSQAFEDGVVEGLGPGYPEAQARCIAKAFVEAVRDGTIVDPDNPDQAVLEAILERCVTS